MYSSRFAMDKLCNSPHVRCFHRSDRGDLAPALSGVPTGVEHAVVWAVLYVVAVIGPALMSGYPSIVAFGVLNLVGLVVVAVLYVQAFVSLWCIYAAVMSVLVLVHMVLRRRLPDPHRYHGVELLPPAPTSCLTTSTDSGLTTACVHTLTSPLR
jgi:hypothetical protein